MIRIRGRNGWFTFRQFSTWVGEMYRETPVGLSDFTTEEKPEPLEAAVDIFSSSPHTRHAPVQFVGPPREVARLLRKIAREIDAQTRANSGATVKTKKGKA